MFKSLHIDLRSLALMRIGIGVVLLIDICFRMQYAEAFYSNTGILPFQMLKETIWHPYWFTLHNTFDSIYFQYTIFIVHAIASVMLILGIHTRFFSFFCWILLISSHSRNPFILQGGDDLIRLILLLGVFIPWGEKYSVDAKKNPPDYNNVYLLKNWAVLVYVIQISFVYFFSALMKGPEWYAEFTAVYYTYQLKHITYESANWLSQFPYLLKILTALVFYIELLVILLIFSPYKNQTTRFIACIVIMVFHLWNGLTINVGLFFAIGIVSSLGLLPSFVMNSFEDFFKLNANQKHGAIFNNSLADSSVTVAIWFAVIVYITSWNLSNCTFITYKMDKRLKPFAHILRIDQNWGMFAPAVYKDDGWFVFEAVTINNDTIDLLRKGRPVTHDIPNEKDALFKQDRWRKYGEHLKSMSYGYLRAPFCKYIARTWNEHAENKIGKLRIVYWKQNTLPDYKRSIPERDELYEITITPPLSVPHQN